MKDADQVTWTLLLLSAIIVRTRTRTRSTSTATRRVNESMSGYKGDYTAIAIALGIGTIFTILLY